MPARILHYVDSTDLRHGGVPRFVLDAARVMAGVGSPSTILSPDLTDTPQAWLDATAAGTTLRERLPAVLPTLAGRLPGGFLNRAALAHARELMARHDVLHLHCVWSPAQLQLAAAARAMGMPYIVTTHGMLDDWCMTQGAMKKRAFLWLGARRMLEGANRVHCTASGEVAQSKKWFPMGREFVTPYLMDLDLFRDLPGPDIAQARFPFLRDPQAPTALFLSRLHVKKGIEHLLAAAAALRDQGTTLHLALAGPGDEAYVQSLRAMTTRLGLDDRVHFVGMVKGREKASLYQAARLFVLPTSQENFGLVLTEAMACGTPVVTTRGTDIWQDLQSSGGASIVDQDAAALASELGALLSDPARLDTMGAKARPWVFETYDERVLTPRYQSLYEDVARERHSPAPRKALAHA